MKKVSSKGKLARPSTKQSKSNTSAKTSKVNARHAPTLQCHEEVMSNIYPFNYNEEPVGNAGSKSQEYNKPMYYKERQINDINLRPTYLKAKDGYQYQDERIDKAMSGTQPKALKSRSTPHLKKQNFEDCVDFIPVKLSSNDDWKLEDKAKQDIEFKFLSGGKSSRPRSCRATWDELLRCESQDLRQTNKSKSQYHNKINKTHLQNGDSLPSTPKKKVSIVSSQIYEHHNKDLDYANEPIVSSRTDKGLIETINVGDPVKTLDFLVKQLREKLQKQVENDNLQQIILDMENALLKISFANCVPPEDKEVKKSHDTAGCPSNLTSKSALSNRVNSQNKNCHLDYYQLHKGLEESCLFLQSLCIKQKETCTNHIREKEQLILQLAESRRLLAIATSREKDYEVTIGELRLKIQELNSKLDQQHQSVHELTDTIVKLRTENELLRSFKEATKKLDSRLKEVVCEKELLNSKLSLKELEIEKLKVLLKIKENTNVSSKKKNDRIYEEKTLKEMCFDTHHYEKDNSLLSMSTVSSMTQDKLGIACSSQASSSPRLSPSPYNSWQHISSIYQRPSAALDLHKGISDIFQKVKQNAEQHEQLQLDLEVPSSDNSFWSDRDEQNISGRGNGT